MKSTTLGAVLAVVVLTLTACGQEKQPAGADVIQTGAATSAAPASAAPEADVAADVKITSCVSGGYTPKITIEVTNSTSEDQRYAATIGIKDADGNPAGEALFAKNRMTPGQKVTEEIPGDTPVQGKITCEVARAKRLPPK
jgi:hypothetical protein